MGGGESRRKHNRLIGASWEQLNEHTHLHGKEGETATNRSFFQMHVCPTHRPGEGQAALCKVGQHVSRFSQAKARLEVASSCENVALGGRGLGTT